MGASNVAAAYVLYAGKVPPLSMVCLTYMALVSIDADEDPWYGEGHAALAQAALGRALPIVEADIRAVERVITPLLKVKAIVADRRPAVRKEGYRTVRYRLQLAKTLFDAPRNPVDVRRSQDPPRPTESGRHVPRNVVGTSHGMWSARPTETVGQRNKRSTEELQEEQGVDIRTDVTVPEHLRIRRARIA